MPTQINTSRLHLLDPHLFASLEGLSLVARLVVEGFLAGLHRSPYHGFSLEFVEHREYMVGDELRHIDWKVFGKRDRFYVRKYEEETNLRAYLVVDVSGSMGFRAQDGVPFDKLTYAKYLTAALAYLLLRQRDSVGLALFADGLQSYLPTASARAQFSSICRRLEETRPYARTDPLPVFRDLAHRLTRRGLIVILSDLLAEPEAVLRGLRYFRHRKHEVLVLHVLDPEERTLAGRLDLLLRDLETGEELALDPRELKATYDQAMRALIDGYRRECRQAAIGYELLDTRTPVAVALRAVLRQRARL